MAKKGRKPESERTYPEVVIRIESETIVPVKYKLSRDEETVFYYIWKETRGLTMVGLAEKLSYDMTVLKEDLKEYRRMQSAIKNVVWRTNQKIGRHGLTIVSTKIGRQPPRYQLFRHVERE